MNKIQNFFRKADTILFQVIWGTLLFLIIYMLLNYSNFPIIIVFLIPCFFMYIFIKKSKIAATIGGIAVGVVGVLMKYGLAGMTLMIGDFFSENTEAAWLLLIVIAGAWYMIRQRRKKR